MHNLKLAAAKVDGIVIKPGECPIEQVAQLTKTAAVLTGGFSVGQAETLQIRLVFVGIFDSVAEGKAFSWLNDNTADPNELAGIDATIAEGWLDLKVKNDTCHAFQISCRHL